MAIVSACSGLDSVKIVVTDDPNGAGGANPSGGNGSGGSHQGGGTPGGGDSSEGGAAGAIGAAGDLNAAGSPGTAGDAGSGGEGGEIIIPTDPMPGPPTVVAVTPRDQSTTADPAGSVRVSFSEPLDPTSVTGESVQIKDAAGAVVSGSVTYADAAATFNPKSRLNLLGSYTVNVTTGITDAGKTPMARPFTSSFTVKDGTWARSEGLVSTSTTSFDRGTVPVLASDGVGRAVAAWTQVTDTGTNYDVYATLFAQGKGWATPVKVNTNALRCTYPSVSMNASGNLIVGWIEYDATATTQPYSVQARRNIGGTWDATSTRVDILSSSTLTVNPENVTVAISANNHAHVAWDAYDYNSTATPAVNDYGVFTRHADAAGTWDAAGVTSLSYLQPSTGNGASGPSLAFDAAGNGFAAYQFIPNASPAKVNTVVLRYVASTNKWGTSAVSSTASDGAALAVGLATNPAGEAILAWVRNAADTTYDLMGSYYNKAWNAPTVISSATTAISSPLRSQLASARWTGASFLVAWAQSGGSGNNVYVNEFKSAWSGATIVSDGNHGTSLPWLTTDGRGNALAVWAQTSDTAATSSLVPADIVFSRFLGATSKWSNPGRVSTAVAGYRYPQAVTLGDGSALATWQRTINNANIKLMSANGVLGNEFN